MTKDQRLMYQRGKKLCKSLKNSIWFKAGSDVDDEEYITIRREEWEKAWKSEEEFTKFIEGLTIESAIKCGYAKNEQDAIRLLGFSRSTDGKE